MSAVYDWFIHATVSDITSWAVLILLIATVFYLLTTTEE